MTRNILYRSVWLPAALTAVLLLIALALLVGMSWRSLQRLGPVHSHMTEVSRLEQTSLDLQELLLQSLSQNKPVDPTRVKHLRHQLDQLIAMNGHLSASTPERLRQARASLNQPSRASLAASLAQMRRILPEETSAHDHMLETLQRNTRMELEIAVVLMIAFPTLIVVTLFFLRKRILVPLNNLGTLMSLLAAQDYTPTSPRQVDPLLQPLFENYNDLVSRLAELETHHQARQHTLENEVRTAAQALLEQQRTLARTERLAAVGEVAAGLAHELRNPLAGIQMALGNLRRDLTDPDQAARLDLVINELKRLTRLLNDQLTESHQVPEPLTDVPLAETVDDLLTLVRYQVPEHIELRHAIPATLHCPLPTGRLRQALLNLVLNAAQAIGDRAGSVEVLAARDGQQLTLQVCDDGPGLPSDLLDNGIRSFATWRDNGTGLGLSMVRRFARELDGELRLSNRPEGGACVELILPCKENHG
ncbi:MAG: HAMP domain-containing sensor histidine kinase [Gammaproteobacteria bacterium]